MPIRDTNHTHPSKGLNCPGSRPITMGSNQERTSLPEMGAFYPEDCFLSASVKRRTPPQGQTRTFYSPAQPRAEANPFPPYPTLSVGTESKSQGHRWK